MKQGTRPTLKQKLKIEEKGLNANDYLVEREVSDELALINKKSGLLTILRKDASKGFVTEADAYGNDCPNGQCDV